MCNAFFGKVRPRQSVGAGSRGQGRSCPPGDILVLLGDFFCPPETCTLSRFWDKKTLQIRRKPFFFRDKKLKKLSKSGEDLFLFFIFGERLFSGQKNAPFPAKTFISRSRFWRSRSCRLAPPVQK